MILDNFSNTSKVLEQENIDELNTGTYVNFELCSSNLLPLSRSQLTFYPKKSNLTKAVILEVTNSGLAYVQLH